jgi:hypothetical protein
VRIGRPLKAASVPAGGDYCHPRPLRPPRAPKLPEFGLQPHGAFAVGGLAMLQPVVQGQGALPHGRALVERVFHRPGEAGLDRREDRRPQALLGLLRLAGRRPSAVRWRPAAPQAGDARRPHCAVLADDHPLACQNSTRRSGPIASREVISHPRGWPLFTLGDDVAPEISAGRRDRWAGARWRQRLPTEAGTVWFPISLERFDQGVEPRPPGRPICSCRVMIDF